MHHGHLHRGLGDEHLRAEGLGEPADPELRGRVGAEFRLGEDAVEAGDVDDVPVAGGDQVREECLGAVDDAHQVDGQDPVEDLPLGVGDGAAAGDARVVVDLVHHAEVRGHLLGVVADGLPVADVQVRGVAVGGARVLEQFRGLGEAGVVDVADGEPGAAPGQAEGQLPADAGSRSGDDGDLAGETAGHEESSFEWRGTTIKGRPPRCY
jgi:hypothetical protein